MRKKIIESIAEEAFQIASLVWLSQHNSNPKVHVYTDLEGRKW